MIAETKVKQIKEIQDSGTFFRRNVGVWEVGGYLKDFRAYFEESPEYIEMPRQPSKYRRHPTKTGIALLIEGRALRGKGHIKAFAEWLYKMTRETDE